MVLNQSNFYFLQSEFPILYNGFEILRNPVGPKYGAYFRNDPVEKK